MQRNVIGFAVLGLALVAGDAAAQATATPSFNAPYRAFTRYEFGGTVSFQEGDLTNLEGQFRFGYRAFDIGFRGGIGFVSDPGEDQILLGAEARYRVLTHTADFPLDGALIVGGGFRFDGGTIFNVPVGLSLGRRLDVEGSQVSIVPYVQPTLFMYFGDVGLNDNFEAEFGFGFGADFRLSRVFDVRVSGGIGTDGAPEGVAISAVWIR